MDFVDTVKKKLGLKKTQNWPLSRGQTVDNSVGPAARKTMLSSPTQDSPYNDTSMDVQKDQAKIKNKGKFAWLYSPSRGVRWDHDPVLLRSLAQGNVWASMLIEAIVKEISNIPWQISEKDTSTSKRYSKSPFARKSLKQSEGDTVQEVERLLEKPNKDNDFTDLVEMTITDQLEIGSLSILKDFPESAYKPGEHGPTLMNENAKPQRLRISDPAVFTKEFSDNGLTDAFWMYDRFYSGDKGRYVVKDPIRFKPREIIWSDINKRSNRAYGLPPTLMIEDILELMDLTLKQEKRYFQRGMIPSGMLVWEELDNKEIQNYVEQVEANIKGQPHKLLNVGGDGGDVRFESFSFNFKELQFLEREQWYSKIISSVFRVPQSVVGLKPEEINRATFEGERDNFESNTLGPYLQRIERFLNQQLVWKHFSKDLMFEFVPGLSEKQRDSISGRVVQEFNNNILKRNEARRQLGYDEVDEDGFKDEVVEDSGGGPFDELQQSIDSIDDKKKVTKNESLRETENWYEFGYQPSDVEELKEEISEDVETLFNDLLSSEKFQLHLENMVDESKSLNEISTEIMQFIKSNKLVEGIKEKVQNVTSDKVKETLENNIEETDLDVDKDKIVQRVQDRDMDFALDYSKRMESEVRETVAEGREKGLSVHEMQENLKEKAEGFSDYQAERVARDQMQKATGESRNEFAKQHDDKFVEVWLSSEDDRVRDAHSKMNGKWKRPHDKFIVPYESGPVEEDFPGDSKKGINCRCTTLLKDRDEVGSEDYAGNKTGGGE